LNSPQEQFIVEKEKVPVELFVMSRCPDAITCEAVIAEVGVYHTVRIIN